MSIKEPEPTRLRMIQDLKLRDCVNIKVSMTSVPRSVSPLIMLSMAVLIWIVLLYAGLRFILGNQVCSAWLIVGLMVTAAAMGFLLLTKEFVEAVMVPGPCGFPRACNMDRRDKSTCRRPSFTENCCTVDPSSDQIHRSALGLTPRHDDCNRRRSQPSFRGLGRRCLNRGNLAKSVDSARTPQAV